jgi:hydrogenase nickel incorporation protein HypA/HybF
MHEFHVMKQVLKAVEAGLHGAEDAKLSAVRLKVSTLSHLLTQDHAALQTAFALAARGTRAEGAKLEIIPVSGGVWCPRCNRGAEVTGVDDACPRCGGLLVAAQDAPEVTVHELVVEE